MSPTRMFSYLFGKGFSGGPDFDSCESYSLKLEMVTLDVTLPRSNVVVDDESRSVYFPFQAQGWFDAQQRQMMNHFYVSILAKSWAYLGPYWKVKTEPFGIFSVELRIKRALPGDVLAIDELKTLEKTIRREHEEYYEAKEPGDYFRGHNTEVRRKADLEFAPRPHPTSRDLEAEKAQYLKLWLREIPEKFGRPQYNGRPWVHYGIDQRYSSPVTHYCHALDARYYLDIEFTYGVDSRQYFHIWKGHAEQAEQRIMESVRLVFPGDR